MQSLDSIKPVRVNNMEGNNMAKKETAPKKAAPKTAARKTTTNGKQSPQVKAMNMGAVKSTGTRAAKARNAVNTVKTAMAKYKADLSDKETKIADQEYNLRVLQETLTLAKEKHDPELEPMIQEYERLVATNKGELNKNTIHRDALRNVMKNKDAASLLPKEGNEPKQ